MEHASRLERTALVVDDDAFVVAALAELLEDGGFDVHTASNGFSALRLLAEQRPSLILLDLLLPERSGAELLEDVRADPITHDVAIVVVTAHADGLSDAQRASADAVLSKPFDTDELLATVERALRRAACRRSEVAPVTGASHRDQALRSRRAAGTRRSRPRR